VYLALVSAASVIIAFNIWGTVHDSLGDSFRYAAFQVAAIITTTGFGTDDFEQWPALSQSILVLLFFFGGSAGSTAGGMKLIRIIIIIKLIWGEVRRGYRPNLVTPVRVGRHAISNDVMVETMAYALVFLLTVAGGGIVIAALEPVDITTALSASLACVANVGPGLGDVGPTDNYGFFSAGTKVFLTVLMLLGRLEFFAVLALFAPGFWRR